ncbi:hypothetical protein ACX27_04095 [Nostoc piscinale CENA21]|uniref:Uncharacterized protein n=1 Tax=Nostoc piscinale CENA21 TaxID=224013 RepID=A0A0M3V4M9_9NOSO|nr:hypothetical protein [Nostoc piscinale]ALF52217.1 hypothetical protein ACX27_04095 [Nostoc piscinale CENA21]
MTSRKKPTTAEELKADIENHPERGKLNGDDVVAFDKVEFRGNVPREIYRLALEVGGALGDDKSTILVKALEEYVIRRLELLERSQRIKSKKFGVDELEIRSKTFGAYKAKGRAKKANLQAGDE